jgi:hypothetical protein
MNSVDRIGVLLKLAGPRPMPDEAHVSRAKAAARREWRRLMRRRRVRTMLWSAGTAALIASALAKGGLFPAAEPPRPVAISREVATLDAIHGRVLVSHADGREIPVRTGMRLRAGERLTTGAMSRAVVTASTGASVKIDHESIVVLDAAGRTSLVRGALFVDAGPDLRDDTLYVTTAHGVVRHIGTQFEVRLQGEATRVRVREGLVSVANDAGRWITREGEALVVAAGGLPERHAIAVSGDEWRWIDDLAPPFTLEGSTGAAFLEWAGRHHGMRWAYAEPGLGERMRRTVLHGSIEGLTGEEAFEAVVRTSGLTMRRDGERFIIEPSAAKYSTGSHQAE